MNNDLSTCVLGSSSAGNSTLIWNTRTAIHIDCGFTPAYITTQLRRVGLSIQNLDGVFITHIHGDHVNEWTVKKLVDEHIPIYCSSQIESHLQKKYSGLARASRQSLLKSIKNSELELSEFHIRPFEVPHDSDGGCFGYNVFYNGEGRTKKVSVSTDMAYATKSVIGHIANSDVMVIESNYDVQMLEESARTVWLKRRIREEGHLSNDQCGESLLQIIDRSQTLPKSLALALECTEAALDRQGVSGISVHETHPDRPGSTITV